MSLLKYVTIVNQNGESSKSTKRKTTDHQEKIKEYEKKETSQNQNYLPEWASSKHILLARKLKYSHWRAEECLFYIVF
jgi:hypothetical protein